MKNKRGILLASETLKIVLAVVGIAILAYLLFALYSGNSKGQELVEAQNTLDQISATISKLKTNSSYVGETFQLTPKGWAIFSFVQNEIKPNQCSGQSCVCICDKVSDFDFFGFLENRQEKECSKYGTCLIEGSLLDFDHILIEENNHLFTSIQIKRTGGLIEIKKI